MTTNAERPAQDDVPPSGQEPASEVPVVETVEVVETNQPMDEWGED